jgi:UTP-glucose-1-phosphate uridylyltransferase
MKAVIMAGGFGTRIQPLTKSVPKPMLDVVNIPMMEHILNRVIKAGIKEVVILLYFKPEVIKEYFGNGSKWGVFLNIDDNFDSLFIKENVISLVENHTVAGNPMRFKTGKIELKLDEEWREKLNPFIRKFVTIITYPYLKKYGYL